MGVPASQQHDSWTPRSRIALLQEPTSQEPTWTEPTSQERVGHSHRISEESLGVPWACRRPSTARREHSDRSSWLELLHVCRAAGAALAEFLKAHSRMMFYVL